MCLFPFDFVKEGRTVGLESRPALSTWQVPGQLKLHVQIPRRVRNLQVSLVEVYIRFLFPVLADLQKSPK
jgi:hypothetical protein